MKTFAGSILLLVCSLISNSFQQLNFDIAILPRSLNYAQNSFGDIVVYRLEVQWVWQYSSEDAYFARYIDDHSTVDVLFVWTTDSGSNVVGIDSTNGFVAWNQTYPTFVQGASFVSNGSLIAAYVYETDGSSTLSVLNATTGIILHSSPPFISTHDAFAASQTYAIIWPNLYSIDAAGRVKLVETMEDNFDYINQCSVNNEGDVLIDIGNAIGGILFGSTQFTWKTPLPSTGIGLYSNEDTYTFFGQFDFLQGDLKTGNVTTSLSLDGVQHASYDPTALLDESQRFYHNNTEMGTMSVGGASDIYCDLEGFYGCVVVPAAGMKRYFQLEGN